MYRDGQKNMSTQTFIRKSYLKEITIIGLILIFITLLLSVYFNYYLSKKVFQLELEFQKQAALKKEQKETPQISLPKVLYNLTGEIKSLEGDTIVFDANIPVMTEDNQLRSKIETRKAIITPNTKITTLTFLQKEGENKKAPVETNISLKELKIGDYIEVISNQDISQKEEFEITQIRVLPQ